MTISSEHRSYLLVLVSVFGFALALRLVPLYWSPLPATLDGIEHAAHARDALATGHLPLEELRADHLVFVTLLASVGSILGVAPITIAQPFSALVGAASCLVGIAIVHRLCVEIGWSARRTRVAVALVGLSLAAGGVYLRRTGLPDEEILAHLLLPLLALSLHRTLLERDRRFAVVTIGLLGLFPITHTLSTLIALLVVAGLLAVHLVRDPTPRTAAVGTLLVGGFWAYAAAYYELAGRSAVLTVPYVDRVEAFPGLFLAWLVVLLVGVVWFQRTTRWSRRAVFFLPIAIGFLTVFANLFTPVFPGTIDTPLPVAVLVATLVIPAIFASGALSVFAAKRSTAAVLLAPLAGAAVLVAFSLTATLTPEYFGTVMRVQTFAHLPAFTLAALTAARIALPTTDRAYARSDRSATVNHTAADGGTSTRARHRPAVRALVVGVLVVSVFASTPIAYINLDTGSYPSTTTESEFRAAAFAADRLDERWSGDHTLTRIAGYYHYDGGPANGTMYDAREWLRGGSSPCRPTLSQRSWTTTGAHFFPAAPETIPPARYDAWIARRDRVYAAGGLDPLTLTIPRSGADEC
jgi:uncharacterized membrane protein (DUF485 family)